MLKLSLRCFFVSIALAMITSTALAQDVATPRDPVNLKFTDSPQTEEFPWISMGVRVYDANNLTYGNLDSSDFILDGQAVTDLTVMPQETQLNTVIIVDASPIELEERDRLIAALEIYMNRIYKDGDNITLLTINGLDVRRWDIDSRESFLNAILAQEDILQMMAFSRVSSYQDAFRMAAQTLSPALDNEENASIVLFAPYHPQSQQASLLPAEATAYPRFVFQTREGGSPSNQFGTMASAPNNFLIFNSDEVDGLMQPLLRQAQNDRIVYQLRYRTTENSPEERQVRVQAATNDGLGEIFFTYQYDIGRPRVIIADSGYVGERRESFSIRREGNWVSESPEAEEGVYNYERNSETIHAMVTFPDTMDNAYRQIEEAALLIDGETELVAQPGDNNRFSFVWDLAQYNEQRSVAGELQVRVVDNFGMEITSAPIAFNIVNVPIGGPVLPDPVCVVGGREFTGVVCDLAEWLYDVMGPTATVAVIGAVAANLVLLVVLVVVGGFTLSYRRQIATAAIGAVSNITNVAQGMATNISEKATEIFGMRPVTGHEPPPGPEPPAPTVYALFHILKTPYYPEAVTVRGSTIAMNKPSWTIGRNTKQVDMAVGYMKVSRLHCEIRAMGDRYPYELWIQEIEAQNGTIIVRTSGERITVGKGSMGEQQLFFGDEVHLGWDDAKGEYQASFVVQEPLFDDDNTRMEEMPNGYVNDPNEDSTDVEGPSSHHARSSAPPAPSSPHVMRAMQNRRGVGLGRERLYPNNGSDDAGY